MNEFQEWLKRNQTEPQGETPDFEYYTGLNNFLGNYYPYLTVFCQGNGYLFSVLYHFTNYRYWNFLGTMIAILCLPVDIFIFWLVNINLNFKKRIIILQGSFIPVGS